MKIGRLYIKIFLSFLLVLFVTEILIFGFFSIVIGRKIHERFEKEIGNKTLLAKELIEEKIKTDAETDLTESAILRDLILRIGEIYNANVWLSGSDGTVLLKSFAGNIPTDIIELSEERISEFEGFKIYSKYGRDFGKYYLTGPIRLRQGITGDLHIFAWGQWGPEGHPRGPFAIGLAVIGLVIALLIIPVSRNISKPIKWLRESALRIADGELSHRAEIKSKDEIGSLGRAFNRMADKLERMIRGGRELTANVSHELRTPLARIRISEQLLREKWEKSKFDEYNRHLDEKRRSIPLNSLRS